MSGKVRHIYNWLKVQHALCPSFQRKMRERKHRSRADAPENMSRDYVIVNTTLCSASPTTSLVIGQNRTEKHWSESVEKRSMSECIGKRIAKVIELSRSSGGQLRRSPKGERREERIGTEGDKRGGKRKQKCVHNRGKEEASYIFAPADVDGSLEQREQALYLNRRH